MFAFKQLVGTLIMPLPLAASLLALGLACRFARRLRAAAVLYVASAAVAVLATLGCVGNGLLWPLETRHAALIDPSILAREARYVVVLGSGYRPREDVPVTAALDASAIVRIAEGMRVFRQLPAATLILSGGPVGGNPPSAVGYRELAMEWGVPAESILLMDDVLDTGAEIRELSERIGGAPVVLVTSASHMPRAMEYCDRYGVRAIAAPTGHLAEPLATWGVRGWLLPSGVHLRKTETALHEYVGLLAMRLGLN